MTASNNPGQMQEYALHALALAPVEVLQLLVEGLTYKEVGERLVISVNTVRYHVKGLYGKLGVSSRVAAIARRRALGVLPRPSTSLF
jgi:LuxR family maltose regulon positive regulatory protein